MSSFLGKRLLDSREKTNETDRGRSLKGSLKEPLKDPFKGIFRGCQEWETGSDVGSVVSDASYVEQVRNIWGLEGLGLWIFQDSRVLDFKVLGVGVSGFQA